jgi:hypothetical protein
MFCDRRQNVGFLERNVGWMSGFSKEPDICFLSHISVLRGKCREWQVFLEGESCHEISKKTSLDLYAINPLKTLDLHDLAS